MGKRFDPNDFLNDDDFDDFEGDSSIESFGNYRMEEGEECGPELDEYNRGMQKMVARMVTTYLMSKEAEELGVVGFKIMKEATPEGYNVKSSFIIDKKPSANDFVNEILGDLPDFIKEMLVNNSPKIVGIDMTEFMKQVKQKEVEKDEQPKRKRGRPKKEE